MNTVIKTLPLVIAAATLAACNPQQDGGGNKTQNMNGQAVDGRIANGLVFVDRNGNGRWDSANEPSARTDAQGFYSYNPGVGRTAIDYCDEPNSSLLARHCLEYSSNEPEVDIIITGGIDISTGERLKAAMVMGTTLQEGFNDTVTTMRRISPISTLLNSVTTPAERQALVAALAPEGMSESDLLRRDFSQADTAENRRLLSNAVTIVALQSLINDVKGDDGSDKTPAERQREIAKSIAQSIANGDDLFGDDNVLETFVSEQLRNVSDDDGKKTAAIDSAVAVRTALRSLADSSSDDQQDIDSRIRAAEVVFQLARRAAVDGDDAARTSIGQVNSTSVENIRSSLFNNVGSDEDFDVQSFTDAVKAVDIENDDLGTAAGNASLQGLPEGQEWGDNTWRVFRVDPNSDSGDVDDIDTETYLAMLFTDFAGQAGTGQIWACFDVVLKEGVENDSEFNINKQFVFGNWDELSRSRIAIDLKWNRFTRDGQIVYAGIENDITRFRVTHDSEDAKDFDETMILDTEWTNELQNYGPDNRGFGSPTSNAECESLHNVLYPPKAAS